MYKKKGKGRIFNKNSNLKYCKSIFYNLKNGFNSSFIQINLTRFHLKIGSKYLKIKLIK